MTKDEVITALECCIVSKKEGACQEDCPRNNDPLAYRDTCEAALMRDAIALLKQDNADFVDGIQTMREICNSNFCTEECPAAVPRGGMGLVYPKCAFAPEESSGLSPQEVAEIIWAYKAKKRKEEKADG